MSVGSAYEWPGWGQMSGPHGDGGWVWAVASGIRGRAHRARNKTQESRLPGLLPSPDGYKEGKGRPVGFEGLWAGEGLLRIKKHQFLLRFCCSPHRKGTFLDFKRMTSFFFLFT